MSTQGSTVDGLLDRRYRLLGTVGQGQIGCVYKAVHVGLGTTVALRMLPAPPDASSGHYESTRRQFVREARQAVSLSHPNLPRIHDFFSVHGADVLVTDYIEGETLAERAHRLGRLPLWEVVRYALELCDVLGYLHRQDPPIFWGDTKLSDAIIARDGRMWLVDVGIARRFAYRLRIRDQVPGVPDQAASQWYSAPGQLNAQADLVRLGGLLHEMIGGYTSPAQEIGPRFPQHVDSIAPLPPAMGLVIQRALAADPADRFASAEEFHLALDGVASALAAASPPVPSCSPPSIDVGAAANPGAPGAMARASRNLALRRSIAAAPKPTKPRREATPPAAQEAPQRAPAAHSRGHALKDVANEAPAHEHPRQRAMRALGVAAVALAVLGAAVLAASLGPAISTSSRDHISSGMLRPSGEGLGGTPAAQMLGSLLGSPPPPTAPAVTWRTRATSPMPKPRPSDTPIPKATATATATAIPTATASPIPTTTPTSGPSGPPVPVPTPPSTPVPAPTPAPTPTTTTPPTPDPGNPPTPGATLLPGSTPQAIGSPVAVLTPDSAPLVALAEHRERIGNARPRKGIPQSTPSGNGGLGKVPSG